MTGGHKGTQASGRRTYTVQEIADMLGISTKAAYCLVRKEQFAHVRVGSAIRVSKDSFDRWLDPRPAIKEET